MCFIKIIIKEDSTNSILNIGYACSWIGQLSIKSENKKEGLYFLKLAMNSWEDTSPPRYAETKKFYDKVIFDKETKQQINDLSPWRVEEFCKKFISQIII